MTAALAKLSAMEQAKNTTWDLIDLETNDAITACDEGLLQKFDKKSLGKTSDFIPGSISDCAVASMVWSTVYAYDCEQAQDAADARSTTSSTCRNSPASAACASRRR